MSENVTVVTELPAKPRRLSKKFIITVAAATAVAVAAVAVKKNLAQSEDSEESSNETPAA